MDHIRIFGASGRASDTAEATTHARAEGGLHTLVRDLDAEWDEPQVVTRITISRLSSARPTIHPTRRAGSSVLPPGDPNTVVAEYGRIVGAQHSQRASACVASVNALVCSLL